MSPTLVRHQPADSSASLRGQGLSDPAGARARARDWAEIQERMLVPLYDAAYDRLGIGTGTRLLGLGCGSGLALLLAAARGAQVSGVDTDAFRLALARERLAPDGGPQAARLVCGGPAAAASPEGLFPSGSSPRARSNVITAFHPPGCGNADQEPTASLTAAAALAERGSAVVLGGWGPVERCTTAGVLLEDLAERAGLRPDGSGRVACPFGYADAASAVRGLLSTGVFDAALEATERRQVEKELGEALHPYQRADGTVWMPNVFRYVIARTR